MKEIVLKVRPREKMGKEHAKKLRRSGFIPAVVYGPETPSVLLEIETKSFYALLRGGLGENILLTLTMGDEKDGGRKVLIKEIQRDPVKGDVQHVDFHQISLTKKLSIEVPIHLMGAPVGVKDGGILQHVLRELEVECLPTAIPEKIEVDVNHLKIGDSIHVADIKVENVEILSDPESSIVSVVPPTVFKEVEVAPVVAEEEPEVITEKKEEEKEEGEKKEEKGKEAKAEKKPAEEAKEEKKKEQK
ncbi:MAG: 50S ribosomal protein L25/general stress protein Ctc [candidate division Zixibacteria bacterium]|nr:50S ribosomal protein L25/general stress protein Ctc [candidate division Zixibacteria bacterium]